MHTGYGIVALIWTIVCASCEVYADNSTDGTITAENITRDLPTDIPTTSFFTSSNVVTEEPIISIESLKNDVPIPDNQKECYNEGKIEFFDCLDKLGTNSMKHFTSRNITEFLADLCSPDVSKPLVECLARHFRSCPAFLDVPHVHMLQFGPYHIKDIMYFSSVEHMCECSLGLICVQELNKVKLQSTFTRTSLEVPLVRVPDYKAVCDDETSGKFVDCTRKNLERCKFALNQRFHEDFTLEHAEEVVRMYNFRREHCDTVREEGFEKEYMCIDDLAQNHAYKECLIESQYGSPQEQLCGMRACVQRTMGHVCNASMVDIYIDGVNIFRHNQLDFLNYPCSSGLDVGFSFLTVVISVVLVIFY